jgi:hypothetical protein
MNNQRWVNKSNPQLFAEKTYSWIDRVLIIDESDNRLVKEDITFAEFKNQLDQWSEIV